jgi:hypothetical protein
MVLNVLGLFIAVVVEVVVVAVIKMMVLNGFLSVVVMMFNTLVV